MSDAKHDFGQVENLRAEALGLPGERFFRLLLEGPGGDACLWLEKEQLFQLAAVIRHVLTTQTPEETSGAGPYLAPPAPVSLDFKVSRLNLGHASRERLVLIQAYSVEEEEDAEAILEFRASRQQMEALATEALEVCAAGRPRCFLCGAPLGPEPHLCPRSNGHARLQ